MDGKGEFVWPGIEKIYAYFNKFFNYYFYPELINFILNFPFF